MTGVGEAYARATQNDKSTHLAVVVINMAQFSDSKVLSATVGSTSKTLVDTINVSAGERLDLYSMFAAHPQGGTASLSIDLFPQGNFEYMQNSTTITNMGSNNKTPLKIGVPGPAKIEAYVTNAASTSGTAKIELCYNYVSRS